MADTASQPDRSSAPNGPGDVPSAVEAERDLAATLDNLDDAHRYRQWIYDLIEPTLGRKVLEVGAGQGTFTELLAEGRQVVATDLSPRCIGLLESRFAGRDDVKVLLADVNGARRDAPYDSAVMINVLEHIPDDVEALRELATQLAPGGRLAVWVPAHMQLYSDFDRMIGHHRRYTKPELVSRLGEAGFVVDDARYVNMVGAAAWWVVARKLRRAPTGKLGVKVYDRLAVPVVRRIEARWRPPAGQSILALAHVA